MPIKGCCAPAAEQATEPAAELPDARYLRLAQAVPAASAAVRANLRAALQTIPGGIFDMGARRSTFPVDLDSPRRKVRVSPSLMSPTAVTNAEYARFASETGYQTVAEAEGWSFVFHLLLPDAAAWPAYPVGLPWWRRVDGACWAAPAGPGSSIIGREDHPVVHIAWYDALAYCNWAGLSLPTEAQWERAARGGLAAQKFPWGDDIAPAGAPAMNTFRGTFPNRPDADWHGTVPVRAFRPNGFGMFNMTGNVWEWVADRFGALPAAGRLPPTDPAGPPEGETRVQRGGSYLCHPSYCDRYHVHSRTGNRPDSSAGNAGFRVAAPSQDAG